MAKPKTNAPNLGLPDLFHDYNVYVREQKTGEKKPTETLRGPVRAISENHACQVAKKKFGTIRNSPTRTVNYVARLVATDKGAKK
jgi:hypothetical protein